MLFLGTFDYAMDERGRVPLPPRYREAFRTGIVLSQGSPDRCIFLHTMEAFERHARDVTARPALHRSGRVLRRGAHPPFATSVRAALQVRLRGPRSSEHHDPAADPEEERHHPRGAQESGIEQAAQAAGRRR